MATHHGPILPAETLRGGEEYFSVPQVQYGSTSAQFLKLHERSMIYLHELPNVLDSVHCPPHYHLTQSEMGDLGWIRTVNKVL